MREPRVILSPLPNRDLLSSPPVVTAPRRSKNFRAANEPYGALFAETPLAAAVEQAGLAPLEPLPRESGEVEP